VQFVLADLLFLSIMLDALENFALEANAQKEIINTTT
jgi:hypothetical protein